MKIVFEHLSLVEGLDGLTSD